MGLRRLRISAELFTGIFTSGPHSYAIIDDPLPPDAVLINIRPLERYTVSNDLELTFESPTWPDHPPTQHIPELRPTIRNMQSTISIDFILKVPITLALAFLAAVVEELKCERVSMMLGDALTDTDNWCHTDIDSITFQLYRRDPYSRIGVHSDVKLTYGSLVFTTDRVTAVGHQGNLALEYEDPTSISQAADWMRE